LRGGGGKGGRQPALTTKKMKLLVKKGENLAEPSWVGEKREEEQPHDRSRGLRRK